MKISLRRLNEFDLEPFSNWMRDRDLLDILSPGADVPSKEDVLSGFVNLLKSKNDLHFIVSDSDLPIGMVSLLRDKSGWFKMQVMIGEKKYWNRGCDVEAIRLAAEMMKDRELDVFMEVRPDSEKTIAAFTSCGFMPQKIKRCPRDTNFPKVLRMDLSREKPDYLSA